MKISLFTNKHPRHSLAKALPALFCALLVASGVPASAQPAGSVGNLITNDTGAVTDNNPNTAKITRDNYCKRFPFCADAVKHDVLVPISGNGNGNGGGTTTTTQTPTAGTVGGTPERGGGPGSGGRNNITSAAVSAAQGSNGGTTSTQSQTNLKMSALNTTPTKVLAYDTLVVPVGQPTGHWLPGAEPTHMPQYASQADIPAYFQPKLYAMDTPKTKRDLELFDNQLTTNQVPLSDTQYQIIDRENNNRLLELAFDPERIMWAMTNQAQMQGAAGANALAGSAEMALQTSVNRIYSADGNAGGNGGAGGAAGGGFDAGALINIANEQSGVPTAADNPWKTIPQAVWMVQQMYKYVFVPLAILFLLPGAVATQMKCQIVQGFKLNAEDQSSPFEGILRSVIAIFLIPATQLIVSYSIDVGNSMAYSVKDWVDIPTIMDWATQLTYNTTHNDNAILPPQGSGQQQQNQGGGGGGILSSITGAISGALGAAGSLIGGLINGLLNAVGLGGLGDGLGANTPEQKAISEDQLWLSQILQLVFNAANYLLSSMLIVLTAYQLVFMCYLFLLGPLAAAFYAWPKVQAQSSQALFRDVFANWVNAVIIVSLWRFYWMVILAIMTQRVLYIHDSGGSSNLQWEVAVFTCLMGLMMYVPFNPWSFDPAAAFTSAASYGSSMMQGASQALGQAAIAGGANPNQVSAIQNQISQTIAPLAATANNWENQYTLYNPMAQQQGPSVAQQPTGGSTPGGGQQAMVASAPPLAGAAASQPQTPTGGTSTPTTAPPTAGQQSSPAAMMVAQSNPQADVGMMSSPTTPLTPGSSGTTDGTGTGTGTGGGGGGGNGDYQLAVNPSVSAPEASVAMASLNQSHLQPLGLSGTNNGGGQGPGGQPGGVQLAMADMPAGNPGGSTPGSANDSSLAAGAVTVANTGGSSTTTQNSGGSGPAEQGGGQQQPPGGNQPPFEPPPIETA